MIWIFWYELCQRFRRESTPIPGEKASNHFRVNIYSGSVYIRIPVEHPSVYRFWSIYNGFRVNSYSNLVMDAFSPGIRVGQNVYIYCEIINVMADPTSLALALGNHWTINVMSAGQIDCTVDEYIGSYRAGGSERCVSHSISREPTSGLVPASRDRTAECERHERNGMAFIRDIYARF